MKSTWAEPTAPPETTFELAAELALMVEWLGLDDIVVEPRGDLAAALAATVGSRSG